KGATMTRPKHAWMVRAGNDNELADFVKDRNAIGNVVRQEKSSHTRVSETMTGSRASVFIRVHPWFRNGFIILAVSLFLLSAGLAPLATAQFSDVPPPVQPLRAWTLAIDG